ncbi:unnamed protein product [Blepharisma stoltei]|uniref:Kelch repeat-containing protein n=1 Tax=Blepharisma stoltei TaxID=1481888 RepID=A0AAU9ITL2_9CILI|nr:unnamed protein product [Blepharisma stoltei]
MALSEIKEAFLSYLNREGGKLELLKANLIKSISEINSMKRILADYLRIIDDDIAEKVSQIERVESSSEEAELSSFLGFDISAFSSLETYEVFKPKNDFNYSVLENIIRDVLKLSNKLSLIGVSSGNSPIEIINDFEKEQQKPQKKIREISKNDNAMEALTSRPKRFLSNKRQTIKSQLSKTRKIIQCKEMIPEKGELMQENQIEPKEIYGQLHLSSDSSRKCLYLTDKGTNNLTKLIIYDTETRQQEIKLIETPEPLNMFTCIVELPDSKIFCFGSNPGSGVCYIIDKLQNIQLMPPGTPSRNSGAVYFDNSVYIFGGAYHQTNLNLAEKFDLIEQRWIKLQQLPTATYNCSCAEMKNNFYISGFHHSIIYRFDPIRNTYTELSLKVKSFTQKLLFSENSKKVYVVEAGGSIYSNEIENEDSWHLLSNSILCYYDQVFLAYGDRSVNIGLNYWKDCYNCHYFKFCFDSKTLSLGQEYKA